MTIKIMDTTLRDGEQTPGVAFSTEEEIELATFLLEQVKVDSVEIASSLVSENDAEAIKKLTKKFPDKIEVLCFVMEKAVDWCVNADAKIINLLTKGSLKHVEKQLKKTAEQHLEDIEKVVIYAQEKGLTSNAYLEDWSQGMRDSKEYVIKLIKRLNELNINRIMLADTLGILNPEKTFEYVTELIKLFPDTNFDFHAHNDYGFATANSCAAAKAGVTTIHTTVNGLGERTGNSDLAETVITLKDLYHLNTNVDESKLGEISERIVEITKVNLAKNKPILGKNVFTQTCGVHADGDIKGDLYKTKLSPERFGRVHIYALGKNAGKASIKKNLDELNIELPDEQIKILLEKVRIKKHTSKEEFKKLVDEL